MTNISPLHEVDTDVLFSEQEQIFLFDKDANEEVWRIEMMENANCGLIGLEGWVVIGGEFLILWKNGEFYHIDNPQLRWVFDVQQRADNKAEILIDPWSDIAAIWELDVLTLDVTKIRDFNDYRSKPYQEEVEW